VSLAYHKQHEQGDDQRINARGLGYRLPDEHRARQKAGVFRRSADGFAGFAREQAGQLTLEGRVGASDGGRLLTTTVVGAAGDPEAVGHRAAAELAQQGAREILAAEDGAG